MSKLNELLRLFITYETRGGDKVRREWKQMEREGEGVEKRLSGLDESYADLGKTAEASGKKQRSALVKTAEAVGGVREEIRGLASDSDATGKAADRMASAFGDAADRSVADLQRLRKALLTIGDDEGAVEIGLAIDQAKKREAQAEISAFKAGLDDETVNVTIDYDRSQLRQVGQGFREAASGIRAFEVLAGTVAIPGVISAVAGAIPLVVALTGRAAQLGTALGAGLAGGAAIGGTAVAGMNVGLRLYNALLTSTVQSTREAYLAENEAAAERLENYRNTTLMTDEAQAFNRQIDTSTMRWIDLQAAVGSAVFPQATRELGAWTGLMGEMQPDIVANAGAMGVVVGKFSQWIRTAQRGRLIGEIFGFINRSALGGTVILTSLGRTGARVLQSLVGPADRFRNLIAWGTRNLEKLVMQAKATGMLADQIGYLERRMFQVGHIIGYLIQAFVNMIRAANGAVNMENILNPLVQATRGFRDLTAEGNRGASAITSFMNRSEPALRAFRGLVFEAVRQVLILADALVRAGQSGGRIGTLASVINSVRNSLAPIRLLLQQTFIQLAPALAKLLPAVVNFASAFLGSSNVLVSFVNRITQLLNTFNRLPGPVKTVVIEAVALNSIMSLLGGPTILGLIGGLMRAATTYWTLRAATSASTAANIAAGNATAAMTLKQRAAAIATGAWTVATRVAALASRGLGVALRFMLGPWGLLLTAVVAGVALIVANWSKIRPALQPVIGLFQRAWAVAKQLGSFLGSVFAGNLGKARQQFAQLPASVRPFAMALARLVVAAKNFAQQGLAWLRAQGARFVAWWRSAWPQIQKTGAAVLQGLGRAVRSVAGPALAFLRRGVQQIVSWFRQNWPLMQKTAQAVMAALGRAVRTGGGGAISFLRRTAQAVLSWWRQNWPLIQKTAQVVFSAVAGAVRRYIGQVRTIVMTVVRAVVAFWRQNSDEILSVARSVWNIIKTTISSVIRVVGNIIRAVMQAITGDWKGAWESIKRAVSIALQAMKSNIDNVLKIIRNVVKIAWNAIKQATSAAWNGIKAVLSAAWGAIKKLVSSAASALKNVLSAAWSAIKSAALSAWESIRTSVGDKVQALRDRVGSIVQDLRSGLSGAWDSIKSAAQAAWTAISGFIWRPISTAYTKVTDFLGRIVDAVNKVLGWVGIDPIGEGSGAKKAPTGSGQNRGAQGFRATGGTGYAEGGRVRERPGGVYRVAEAGDDEWVVNPNSSGYLSHLRGAAAERGYDVVRRGTPGGGSRAGGASLGSRPHRSGHPYVRPGTRRNLFPPWRLMDSGGEGLGATMHTYVPEMQDFVDEANAEFDLYDNTYSNHPMGFEQPHFRERSTDFWGTGGRGDPIGTALGDETTRWTIDTLGNSINWLIWNGRMLSASGWGPDTSGFSHHAHQHTTAFADHATISGEGSGGGLFSSVLERGWDRFVQPVIDSLLKPLTGSGNAMVRFAGAAAGKVPEGIKEWALSKLGSTGSAGGGSGLSGTPAQNRKLGEEMFPRSGLSGSFADVDAIWTQESGWDHKAQNPSSSAFGIPQFLDSTWQQYGGVSRDAEGQIRKGYMYIGDRYEGSAAKARSFKEANGWYETGGMAVGPQMMGLGEGSHDELMIPLGDRRVRSDVQQLFQVGQLRDEIARVGAILEGGIRVDSYGRSAEGVILDGYHNAPRRYVRSQEGRKDVGRQMDRRGELERISAGPPRSPFGGGR